MRPTGAPRPWPGRTAGRPRLAEISRPPLVAGISAHFHESAAALLAGGRLAAAAEEERFSRVKHDPRLPVRAFRFCLRRAGIAPQDLTALGYYEEPRAKLSRQLWAGASGGEAAGGDFAWLDPSAPERAIREGLGYEGPIHTFGHHRSHAASAFHFSGFPEAAVLTVDGVGEWATTAYWHAAPRGLELLESVDFPHSLGLLYSTFTSYLGFAVNDGEYKVMGLAPYGSPRFLAEMGRVVESLPGGQLRLDLRYFDFVNGRRMYSPELCDLFGAPPRPRGGELTPFHADVARSLQQLLEEILLEKARYLRARTGAENLCLAGGVALNCVANGRLRREGAFRRLFVPPAAGDSGGALGAAALAHFAATGSPPAAEALAHAQWGPGWSGGEIAPLLAAAGLPALDFRGREGDLLEAVVDRLAGGKVVGWFHGRMEMGPRALGGRSLLADPRDPAMRERLNAQVKKREAFRPFAPSVLAAAAARHFDLDHPSPFMLETCAVRSELDLPAITHVDGSARPQTVDPAVSPRYAALLGAFERRTGCPLLVNTSFNVAGEPIVASPLDALSSLATSGIDALVLEDFLLDRAALPESWADTLPLWRRGGRSPFSRRGSEGRAIERDLYTFV